MSHKQLYTKKFHLNPATIAEMGMLPILIQDQYPIETKSVFNSILRISLMPWDRSFLLFIPEDAEIVSMTATNKYFFSYGDKGTASIISVMFEPYITFTQGMNFGSTYSPALNILIKGPTKEQIPEEDQLHSILKASSTHNTGFYPSFEPFHRDHLLNIDLVVNYTLPD